MAAGVLALVACREPGATPRDAAVDVTMDSPALRLEVSPATVDLHTQNIACASEPMTVTVSNISSVTSGPVTTSFTGTSANDFTISPGGCAGQRLAPAGTCGIELRLAALTVGGKSAALEITAPPVHLIVPVSGTTLSYPVLSISPTSIDFGTVAPGGTSPVGTVTVTSVSNCLTGTFSVTKSGTSPAEFAIDSDQCSGVALAPTTSCTIGVVYAPTATGAKSAVLTVSALMGGTLSIGLIGS